MPVISTLTRGKYIFNVLAFQHACHAIHGRHSLTEQLGGRAPSRLLLEAQQLLTKINITDAMMGDDQEPLLAAVNPKDSTLVRLWRDRDHVVIPEASEPSLLPAGILLPAIRAAAESRSWQMETAANTSPQLHPL